MNTYGYVLANPLRYTDPTGEFGIGGFLLVVGGVCLGGWALIDGTESCEEKYPNGRDPLHPDRKPYIQCITTVGGIVGKGAGMTDPIGTAAGAVGEKYSCDDDNQCE